MFRGITFFGWVALGIIAGLLIYIDSNACNKAGSLASKINWANHKKCGGIK